MQEADDPASALASAPAKAPDTGNDAALWQAIPVLPVQDIGESCAWYAGYLGFEIVARAGEPPFFAHLLRDSIRLHLRQATQPAETGAWPAATLMVENAPALFAEFEAAGLGFHRRLGSPDWGPRSFLVADPDGNLLLFADGAETRAEP